jgi:hypothetical protein
MRGIIPFDDLKYYESISDASRGRQFCWKSHLSESCESHIELFIFERFSVIFEPSIDDELGLK